MITVISATNRANSMTLKVANLYVCLLLAQGATVQLLSLHGQQVWERDAAFIELENKFLIPADKFVFIMPEYNGSFPGVLKMLLDNSDIKKCWWHKKIMLTGVADGRGGNLRGLEHMTNILHYLKMHVHYNKIPISRINDEIDENGNLIKAATIEAINEQVNEFLSY
jgi:chromate reductase